MNSVVSRIKIGSTIVPSSLAEANTYIHGVGEAQSELDRIDSAMALATLAIRAKAQAEAEGPRAKRDALVRGLFTYAQANKATLTTDSKTVELAAGKFLWRYTPPAVCTESDTALIKTLKARGLGEFVRTHESLDRASLLACRETLEAVPGLTFTSREEFVVVPKVAPRKKAVVVTHRID